MLENKDDQEVREIEEVVEQEEGKEITLPAFLLPVVGGLAGYGAIDLGGKIIRGGIKFVKWVYGKIRKPKDEEPELHGFLDEVEDSE